MEKIDLRSLSLQETVDFMKEVGEPGFRGKQLFGWITKGTNSFERMSNLPKAFRDKLKEKAFITNIKIEKKQESREDGTIKYLFGLGDSNSIESVFMKYHYGNSLCISSQAGCRMGCKFCASTIDGRKRNLTAGEMISQILEVENDTGEKINHIVVMGTGEPFDNYENLSKFLDVIHSPEGFNLSFRNITVSTCGIVPRIFDFARDFKQVNLAISLHATTDEIRSSMMPVNDAYPLKELMETCKEYTNITGRRITFEYTMVKGVNDRDEDLDRLISMTKGLLCHINLIPLNKVEETGFDTVSRNRCIYFMKQLELKGIKATVRRELGSDIDGACGQLRLK